MAIELTQTYVTYQAQSKLLELGVEIAESQRLNKPKIQEKIATATKIDMWLQALQYSDYLEKEQIDSLVYCLADLCDANAIPYAPVVTSVTAPTILVGIPGRTGNTGVEGPEGGGVAFSAANVSIDTIVDSFSISTSRAAEWTVNIYGDDGQRTQRIIGGWSADGTSYGDDGGDGTDDIYGDTSPVAISVVVSGTTAQLFAQVTNGTWTIEGTRKYIPNTGTTVVQPTSLAQGKIWIGNSSNVPEAQTFFGDLIVSPSGVTSIPAGTITNAYISSTAAISLSKLAALPFSKVVITDGSGVLTTSSTTATQIGYLSTVTSDVQVQLDSKLSAATGAISTVVSTDLNASRAVISNPLGKIAASNVTSTELGYISGVTSAIQTQLNSFNDSLIPYITTGITYQNTATAGANFGIKLTSRNTVKIAGILTGPVSGGFSSSSVYATLPVGYRPSYIIIKPIIITQTAGSPMRSSVSIDTSGQITFSTQDFPVGSSVSFHFDGLEFDK